MRSNWVLIAGMVLMALGLGVWYVVDRGGSAHVPVPAIASPDKPPSGSRGSTILETPGSRAATALTTEAPASAPDARTISDRSLPDFENIYRSMTLAMLVIRQEELSDAVRSAAGTHAAALIARGDFVRMDQKAADQMDRSKLYPDGRKRFTTKVCNSLPDGSSEFGWLEFPLYDAIGAAELDREQSFVLGRIEELRKSEKRNN